MSFITLAGFRDEDHDFGPPAGFEYRKWQREAGDEFVKKSLAAEKGRPLPFLINAGVGSGKTFAAAGIAAYILNSGMAQRIVYVCPNLAIMDSVIAAFRRFNIYLQSWENPRGGTTAEEGAFSNGIVMTYGALTSRPEIQARGCKRKPTALFLDEVHHLGDKLAWSGAARDAFERNAKAIVSFTGTPWREDNRPLKPFVEMGEPGPNGLCVYRADYSYPLGKAIAEKLCRAPYFRFADASVEIPTEAGPRVVTFADDLPERLASKRLAGAVKNGTPSRTAILRQFLVEFERIADGKSIIFVGGDGSGGQKDANLHLPAELNRLGVPRDWIVSVTSEDPYGREKIRDFGESDARILVVIDMVSEGVDIPQLKAALFLSTVTAKLKLIQRIGRVLRGTGQALIMAFRDTRIVQVASEIEMEQEQYELLALAAGDPVPERAAARGAGRRFVEARGLDGFAGPSIIHGEEFGPEIHDGIRRALEAKGLPADYGRISNVLELAQAGMLDLEDMLNA